MILHDWQYDLIRMLKGERVSLDNVSLQDARKQIRNALKDFLEPGPGWPVLRSIKVPHVKQTLTIEHLMPQSWHEHWPLPGVSSPEEERSVRESLLHTIGNLTLVTDKLNPSLSNGPWPAKREKILEHSALNLNRPLAKLNDWTERKITSRSARLFDTARTIWPCPEEANA